MQMRVDKNGIKTYRPKILLDKSSNVNVHIINRNEESNEIVKIEHGNIKSFESNNNAESPHKKDIILVSVTENMLEILIGTGEDDCKWRNLSLPQKNVMIFNKGYKVHNPPEIKTGSLGIIISQNFLKTEEALSTICIGEPEPCHGVGEVVWSAESLIVVSLPSPPASRVARLVTIHDKVRVLMVHSGLLNGNFSGIGFTGCRGRSECWCQGQCLVLQQSSSFEKHLGRNCSDPNINVKRKYKMIYLQKPKVLPQICILQLININGMLLSFCCP